MIYCVRPIQYDIMKTIRYSTSYKNENRKKLHA